MATKSKSDPKTRKSPSFEAPSGRRVATAAAVVAGVAAVGAGIFFAKEKLSEKPDFETLAEDGALSIRNYPALLVAETVVTGATDRRQALDEGFHRLADYIFAKSRDGEKIAMTSPVLSDRIDADKDTIDAPAGGWRVRFVMPAAYTRETLPPAPADVLISEMPTRRVGAIRFSGLWSDPTLQKKEAELRAWLDGRGETETRTVEYAFYDAPIIPGPLRRNEILIALD